MAMKRTFVLSHKLARERAVAAVAEAPEGFAVTVGEQTRNLAQNAAQWPLLTEFSKQLQWPVNGRMVNMTPDEWKDVLTSAFKREQARLAMGLDGGVVMLGQRTREFSKSEFGEWLEFLNQVAADRGVNLEVR